MCWRRRLWRCPEPARPVGTFTETHSLGRAARGADQPAGLWATDMLPLHHRQRVGTPFGVDWHTLWDAVKIEAQRRDRRGYKHDPLYEMPGLLRPGAEHLTGRQQIRLAAYPSAWRAAGATLLLAAGLLLVARRMFIGDLVRRPPSHPLDAVLPVGA